jgi:hypothetical protein
MEAHLQDLQGKPTCSNFVCETARYRGTTPLMIMETSQLNNVELHLVDVYWTS